MTQPTLKVFLEHILESISLVETFTQGISKDDFFENLEKQNAVLYQLEVIGEATRHIPDNLRKQYPDVPWQDIADMRNNLIHEYFDVDLQIVWDTLQKDLTPLKTKIQVILQELS